MASVMEKYIDEKYKEGNLKEHIKSLYNNYKLFEDYWFKKDGKEITTKLIYLNIELNRIIFFLGKSKDEKIESSDIIMFYYALYKLNEPILKTILKLPRKSKNTSEETVKILFEKKKKFIDSFLFIKSKFDPTKFIKEFGDPWKEILPTLEKNWCL